MDKVLITGTSSGIGLQTALLFLKHDYEVVGFDVQPSKITHDNYHHYIIDVRDKENFPVFDFNFSYIINNAATADERYAIDTNLKGYINIAENYAFQPQIKCVLNVGSISGRDGLDRAMYSASQGGRIAYSKNLAIRLGKLYKARANCMSFGAVLTGLEPNLYCDANLVQAVANENLLNKWIDPKQAAEWIYFLCVIDECCTGQDILVDNGEEANFNWIESEPKLDD